MVFLVLISALAGSLPSSETFMLPQLGIEGEGGGWRPCTARTGTTAVKYPWLASCF